MKSSLKQFTLLTAVAVALVVGFASCEAFTPDALTLANQTFTYTSNGGHNLAAYTFDGTGKAGTFQVDTYSYQYGNTADAAAADASKKSWIQTSGTKGTFTYDPATLDFAAVRTAIYGSTPTAVSIPGGGYTSYGWQTLLEYYNNGGTTYSAYAYTYAEKRAFTTDNVESGVYTNLSGNGTAWTQTGTNTTTRTTTVGSVTTTIVSTDTKSMDVSASAINSNYGNVTTYTSAGTTTTYTSFYNVKNTVSQWFTVGSTAANEDFASSWVDGKTITFVGDRTQTDDCYYSGSAPAAPTTFTNGIGDTGTYGTPPYYRINKNQSAVSMTLAHHGKYFLSRNDSAARQL